LVLFSLGVFEHVLGEEAVDGEGENQEGAHVDALAESWHGFGAGWGRDVGPGQEDEVGSDAENSIGQGILPLVKGPDEYDDSNE
jgi:hypothetical protein